MSSPYIGEIRILPYMRGAPEGWQLCDGSMLSIGSYPTLYQLLGTTYGGDGNTTFGVPDLRSRVPVHQGAGTGLTPRSLGATGGEESVALNSAQMAPHVHYLMASATVGTANTPAGNVLAAIPAALSDGLYATEFATSIGLPANTLLPTGSGQGHDNTAPTLTVQYCIATDGIYPAQP